MKIFTIFFQVCVCLLLFAANGATQIISSDLIADRLARLHKSSQNGTPLGSADTVKPDHAVISEFSWLLDSLKNRCDNPQTAIADTMIESWQILKKNGNKTSLLETSRQLASIAKNTELFGSEKVNIHIISKVWIMSKVSKQPIQEVLKQNPIR